MATTEKKPSWQERWASYEAAPNWNEAPKQKIARKFFEKYVMPEMKGGYTPEARAWAKKNLGKVEFIERADDAFRQGDIDERNKSFPAKLARKGVEAAGDFFGKHPVPFQKEAGELGKRIQQIPGAGMIGNAIQKGLGWDDTTYLPEPKVASYYNAGREKQRLLDPLTLVVGSKGAQIAGNFAKGVTKSKGLQAVAEMGGGFAAPAAVDRIGKESLKHGTNVFDYDWGRVAEEAGVGFGAGSLLGLAGVVGVKAATPVVRQVAKRLPRRTPPTVEIPQKPPVIEIPPKEGKPPFDQPPASPGGSSVGKAPRRPLNEILEEPPSGKLMRSPEQARQQSTIDLMETMDPANREVRRHGKPSLRQFWEDERGTFDPYETAATIVNKLTRRTGKPPVDLPEGEPARAIEDRIHWKPERDPITPANVREALEDFYTRWTNDIHYLHRAEAELGGADHAAYETAANSRGRDLQLESWLKRGVTSHTNQHRIVSDGIAKIADELRSGKGAVSPEHDPFHELMDLALARQALDMSKLGLATDMPIEDAYAIIARYGKHYEQEYGQLMGWNQAVLDNLREAGLLSKGTHEAVKKLNPNFLHFTRLLGEGPGSSEFQNPMYSMIKGARDVQAAINHNEVLKELVRLYDQNPKAAASWLKEIAKEDGPMRANGKQIRDVLDTHGLLTTPETAHEVRQALNLHRIPDQGTEVKVIIDGKARHFQLDPRLYRAMRNIERQTAGDSRFGALANLIYGPSDMLRVGATQNPEFIMANPWRDTFSAWFNSDAGFMPLMDTFGKGLSHATGQSERLFTEGADAWRGQVRQFWEAAGGGHATLNSKYYRRAIKQLEGLLDDPAVRMRRNFTNPLEGLGNVSQLMEESTRLGEFERSLQKTVGEELAAKLGREATEEELGAALQTPSNRALRKAAYASRNITLDFSRMGEAVPILNRLIPFLNPRIQGADVMIRFLTNPATRTRALTQGAIVTAASGALLTENMKDPRWKTIPEWEKAAFYHILRPGQPVIRLPRMQGYGFLFGYMPERLIENAIQKDPRLLSNLSEAFMREFSMNSLPPAISVPMELSTGKGGYSRFTGRPIVPERAQRLDPEKRYTDFTSDTSRFLGELPTRFGMRGIAPAKIDYGIRGLSGGLGRYGLSLSDLLLNWEGNRKANLSLGDMLSGGSPNRESQGNTGLPFVRAFVSTVERGDSQAMDDFYTVLEQVQEARNTYNSEKRLHGDESPEATAYYQKRQPMIGQVKDLEAAMKEFSLDRRVISKVRTGHPLTEEEAARLPEALPSPMTMDAKRRIIRAIQNRMNQTAADKVRAYYQANP